MSINDVIDRMRDAFAELGFPLAEGQDEPARWDELDREIAPLTLPADMRRLLQRVDVTALPLHVLLQPNSLEAALWSWREFRDSSEVPFPASLFPWCYASHNFLFVELDCGDEPGGAMFEWDFGGGDFGLAFRSPRDWIKTVIDVLEERAFERREMHGRIWLQPDFERWNELTAARLATNAPHPIHGHETSVAEDEAGWPEHWVTATRRARARPAPELPPMTIAEVRAARRHGDVRALVNGRAHYLSGTAGQDTRIWLRDDTGALDVLCPVSVRGHGGINTRGVSQVELIARQQNAPLPPVDWYALATPPNGGGPDRSLLLANQPPDAVATVIHLH